MSNIVPRGTDSAQVMVVIKTTAIKGAGTETDPVRSIDQYWSLDGKLLATHDVGDAGRKA